MSSPQPLSAAIIGCGVIAPTHIESLQKLPAVAVRWACDLKREAREAVAAKYGIERRAADYHEVLADDAVDLVCVCTDHASHPQIVCDALAAGKHVLCEKALAPSLEGLEQMRRCHAEHPEPVFSGVFQHRFEGVNRQLRELVQQGALGTLLNAGMVVNCHRTEAYYADDWHGTWAREGGSVLINQAIHFVDLLQWITGGVASVSAQWANLGHEGVIETEDTLVAALRLRTGGLATLRVTSASHINWQFGLSLVGTEGAIQTRNNDPTTVSFKDADQQQRVQDLLSTAGDPEAVESGRAYYGSGHPAQVADVVDAIREGREPYVTGEAAMHTVQVVLAAYESGRTGRLVEVPAPVDAPGELVAAG
jgi:predicted dehydrogenase